MADMKDHPAVGFVTAKKDAYLFELDRVAREVRRSGTGPHGLNATNSLVLILSKQVTALYQICEAQQALIQKLMEE